MNENIERNIIIFIPGLMGSELKNKNNELIWPPTVKEFVSDIAYTLNKNISKCCFERFDKQLKKFFKFSEVVYDLSKLHIIPDKFVSDLSNNENSITGEIIYDIFGISLYRNLFLFLNSLGFSKENKNLISFAYDWRKSNKESALFLAETIFNLKNEFNNVKFTFITHSMGILVFK